MRLARILVIAVAKLILLFATAFAGAGWFAFLLPSFDLLNTFLPIWVTAGIAAAVVHRLYKEWSGWASLCIVILVVSAIRPLVDEVANAASVSGSAPGRPLKLVQFNAFKENPTPLAVFAWVRREQPDVITMEETLGSNRLILQMLRSSYPYQTSCLSRMRCSTVILSREAPIASGGLAKGDPENQHALSAVWMRFSGNGRPFTVIAVHLVRPWPWGNQEPGRAALAAYLSTLDHRRVIMAGDFNLPPWTVAMQFQDRLFGLQRSTRVPTWPAMIDGLHTLPVLPIDHIYVGQDWHIRAVARGPRLGSDHFPVVAWLDDISAPARTSSIRR